VVRDVESGGKFMRGERDANDDFMADFQFFAFLMEEVLRCKTKEIESRRMFDRQDGSEKIFFDGFDPFVLINIL
jgi:hypothetical protein